MSPWAVHRKEAKGSRCYYEIPDKINVKSPVVSIIVPIYNRAHLLRHCVESALAQTHRPIELVLVDDGSGDDSYETMERLANECSQEPGVHFVIARQANGGAPKARNKGVDLASGEWIQFLDSDDTLLPGKIKAALEAAAEQQADIVYSKAQFVDEQGTRIPRFWGRQLTGDWRDYFEFSWQTMCAVYSRDAFRRIGPWNENLVISQDWEFCIRAITSGAKIHFIDRVDALYQCEGSDRIGSGLSLAKHRGRETALWSVYEHLKGLNLLRPELRRRFRSRLIHILLSYRADNGREEAHNLIGRMNAAGLVHPVIALALKKFPSLAISKWILGKFERRLKFRSIM